MSLELSDISQHRNSSEDGDSLSRKLFRPWSFEPQPNDNGDGMTKPLIEEASKKPQSTSAWSRYRTSLRQHFETEPTVRPPGWWNDQMLFDRSLRSMAILMTFYATILSIVCIAYFKEFLRRENPHSTSVGQKKGQSCKSLQGVDIVCIQTCLLAFRLIS